MRLILALLAASSCAAPPVGPPAAGAPAPSPGLPPTDRDPPPYTPPPAERGIAGQTDALSAAGGEDQARRMLPRLIEALRDADGRALTRILAPRVGDLTPGRTSRPGRPRGPLVRRMLLYARRSILPADAEVGALLDLRRLHLVRAARFFQGREAPPTVEPSDLVVEVPLREAARAPLRTLLGWTTRGSLVVRVGQEARIVAY